MLSNDAIKLLRWLNRHDQWMAPEKIKADCKKYNERAFRALLSHKMIDSRIALEGESWAEYRISDSGKTHLEGLSANKVSELREWVNTSTAFISFLAGVVFSDPVKGFFRWIWELIF